MTNEEKELLLKDLCARLKYGVKVNHFGAIRELLGIIPAAEIVMVGYDINDYEDSVIEDIKPYLRPMSSMTEEEKQWSRWYQRDAKSDDFILYMNRYVEWLDSHYFDWRTDGNGKTMIEKGLALEAPEGMYN